MVTRVQSVPLSFDQKGPSFLTGTCYYQPPESEYLGSYEAGPTTVWQLGSIMYELLSGKREFIFQKCHQVPALVLQEIVGLEVSNGKETLGSSLLETFCTSLNL